MPQHVDSNLAHDKQCLTPYRRSCLWHISRDSTLSFPLLGGHRNTKFAVKAAYTKDSDLPEGCPRDLGTWEIGPPPVAPPPGENAKIKVWGSCRQP